MTTGEKSDIMGEKNPVSVSGSGERTKNQVGFFQHYEREGKGVTKADVAAESPVKRFFAELGHRFWQLIVLNLLYLLACIPVVTIGPATAAMNYVCRNFSQAKPVDFFTDFIEKCKEHFKQGFFAFLIQAAIGALLYGSFEAWTNPAFGFQASSGWKTVAVVLIFFVAYLLICGTFYLFPMMVSFDLPLKQLIRNSVILAMSQFWRNLVMLAGAAVFLLLPSLLLYLEATWFLVIPLFFTFSFTAYLNNGLVFPVLKKYVATPDPVPEESEGSEESAESGSDPEENAADPDRADEN